MLSRYRRKVVRTFIFVLKPAVGVFRTQHTEPFVVVVSVDANTCGLLRLSQRPQGRRARLTGRHEVIAHAVCIYIADLARQGFVFKKYPAMHLQSDFWLDPAVDVEKIGHNISECWFSQ